MGGEVTSIWHLGESGAQGMGTALCFAKLSQASIIIDQCSRVFFDRTKPLDLRPEVMDLFAESLNNVVSPHHLNYTSNLT